MAVKRWHVYRETVAKRRAALIEKLGGRCGECGGTLALEFHHVGTTRTWKAKDKSPWERQRLYEQDAAENKIQLKCAGCNKEAYHAWSRA